MAILNKFKVAAEFMVVPFMAGFPWIAIFSSPFVEEVLLRRKITPYDWILLAFLYFIYFFGRKNIQLFLKYFSILSIFSFFMSVLIGKWQKIYSCSDACIGIINRYFDLSCGYSTDGCEIENFILSFLVASLVLMGVGFFRKYFADERRG